jgi:ribosomal protein S10
MSTNKNSIAKLIDTCTKNKNSSAILQFIKKKSRKKIVTVLKSPHVNKTAQEQFEKISILNQVCIKSHRINKFLVLLKKIFLNNYPDIKILIDFKTSNNQPKFTTKPFNHLRLNLTNYNRQIINYNFFFNKNSKTKTFYDNERYKMTLNAKNSLNQFENYSK